MNKIWIKILVIAAVVAAFIVPIVPTADDPQPIRLGLDLKGGSHLVMQVHTEEAITAEVDQAIERMKSQVEAASLPMPEMRRVGVDSFILSPPADVNASEYEKLGRDWLQDFDSAREDGRLRFSMNSVNRAAAEDQTVAQAVETIRNRVDSLGVAEPLIARQGGSDGNRIVIQLPGVDDPARVKEIIRTTAQLQFRIVEGQPAQSPEAALSTVAPTMAADVEALPGNRLDSFGRVAGMQYYPVLKSVPVTGRDLKNARVVKGQLGEPVIEFSLTPEGAVKFGQLTGSNVGKPLAIVLDNKVQSAPIINSRIDDQGVIEGRFTPQEASDLALILRSGSLPASLTTLEERTVGPALGRDSIRQGVTASVVGFIMVLIAVILYYKGAGINASVALILNLVIILGMMAYFNATLTLPGIAGIILTLAMAIDSNVLVFERIREELRAGKSVRASIDSGFSLAFGTVIDTNLTTVIAGLFLFQFGSGPVKGFAVTLLIGIAASVFTAFFVSRVMFDLIYNRGGRPAHISI